MPNFFNKYPYTDFHELNLDWVLETVKRIVAEWAETLDEWHNTQEEWQQLYDYVHNYFDNLDVQEEINNKLDEMAANGELVQLIADYTGWVTPEMFGAKGDGIEDDTQAVLDCFDHGGKILGIGTYLVKQMISVKSGSYIKKLYILSAENDDNIFQLNSVNNITFSNCTILGDDVLDTNDQYYKNAFVINDSANITIEGCDISHVGGSCIYMTNNTSDCHIMNNIFHDNNNDILGREIMAGYAQDTVSNIIIKNNICISHCQMGIITQGENNDIIIDNNIVTDKRGYGICIYGYNAYNSNIKVTNNHVKNISYNSDSGYYDGMGIYCVAVKDYVCTGNTAENVLLNRPDIASPNRTLNPGAITCGDGINVIISDNNVINSKIGGIEITFGDKLNITNNNVEGDIESIYISGSNITVSDNVCNNKLTINNAYQCNDIKLINNYICATIEMRNSSYTLHNLLIQGNTLIGNQTNIMPIAFAENVMVKDNIITSDDSFTGNKIGIRLSTVTKSQISGNIIGHPSLAFFEGIRLENASDAVCNDNIFRSVTSHHYIQVYDTSKVDAQNNKFNNEKVASEYIGYYNPTSPANTVTIEGGTSAPSAGWHHKGSLVFNTSGTSETGWVCTATGTPGTWSSFTL